MHFSLGLGLNNGNGLFEVWMDGLIYPVLDPFKCAAPNLHVLRQCCSHDVGLP